jgi:hypothetical protein
VLWLKDLPCSQLQRLELSRYHIVFDEFDEFAWIGQPAPSTCSSVAGYSDHVSRLAGLSLQEQQPAVAAAAAQAQGSAFPVNSNSGRGLHNLQQFTLVDCGFLMVGLDEQRGRDVNRPCRVLSSHLMHLLPSMMAGDRSSTRDSSGSALRSLKLHDVSLGFRDVFAVVWSALGDHLEELEVHTQSWISTGTGTHQQQPQQLLLPDVAKTMAAAVQEGGLQQLRRLLLYIEEPPTPPSRHPSSPRRMLEAVKNRTMYFKSMNRLGLSVLSACCQLRGLQELRLALTAEQDGEFCRRSEWCACRTRSVLFGELIRESPLAPVPAFAGHWQELLQLRNLRVCDIKVQCFGSKLVQSGTYPVGLRREGVAGVCARCGGAVNASDLCLWVRSVAAAGLTGCQLSVDVVDDWSAIR